MKPSSEHEAHCSSPEVSRAIASRLRRRRVAWQDAGDVHQEVVLALLASPLRLATRDAYVGLARCIADKRAISVLRRTLRRARTHAGLTDRADDHAVERPASRERDPVDDARDLAFFRDMVESGALPRRTARMFALSADGYGAAEIARELRVAPKTVRNEMWAARAMLRRERERRGVRR